MLSPIVHHLIVINVDTIPIITFNGQCVVATDRWAERAFKQCRAIVGAHPLHQRRIAIARQTDSRRELPFGHHIPAEVRAIPKRSGHSRPPFMGHFAETRLKLPVMQELASPLVRHMSHLLPNSLQHGDCVRGKAIVISPLHDRINRIRPHHYNALPRFGQRQHPVVVQQHHRAARHVECHPPMRIAVHSIHAYRTPENNRVRIHLAQGKAGCQQAAQARVDAFLGNEPSFYCFFQMRIMVAAL